MAVAHQLTPADGFSKVSMRADQKFSSESFVDDHNDVPAFGSIEFANDEKSEKVDQGNSVVQQESRNASFVETFNNDTMDSGKNDESAVSIKNAGNCSNIEELKKKIPLLNTLFNIHGKIGEGTFSSVFLATLKGTAGAREFAVKHLVPTCHPARIERELKCLKDIGGRDNVVGVDLCLRHEESVAFVMPYLPHQKFTDYVCDMGVEETRQYMKNLFIALQRVHSFHIIHRDVKPSNFLYDRSSKRFLLVDFGLAQALSSSSTVWVPQSVTAKLKKRKQLEDSENSIVVGNQQLEQTSKRPRLALMPKVSNAENVIQPKKKLPLQSLNIAGDNIRKSEIRYAANNAADSTTMNIQVGLGKVQKFQVLAPEPKLTVQDRYGSSFIRVQNSQVKSHVQNSKASSQIMFAKPTTFNLSKRQAVVDSCKCYGKASVCSQCLVRKVQVAPRAGTPGFRPPEVLLKYPKQTTSVDMWAAGVIFLCILSGSYPFFRSPDDITGLAEIMTLFGTHKVKETALKLGRLVTCHSIRKPLNLKKVCEKLRKRRQNSQKEAGKMETPREKSSAPTCPYCKQKIESDGCLCRDGVFASKTSGNIDNEGSSDMVFPDSAYDLLTKLLDLDPDTRIPASEALRHPFITGCAK